jgi:hypothetical protein
MCTTCSPTTRKSGFVFRIPQPRDFARFNVAIAEPAEALSCARAPRPGLRPNLLLDLAPNNASPSSALATTDFLNAGHHHGVRKRSAAGDRWSEVKEEGRAKSGPEDTNATGRPPFAAVSDIGMCATSRCPISYASDSGDITLTK